MPDGWTVTYRIGTREECIRIVAAFYQAAGGAPMLDLGCRSAPLTKDFNGAWMECDPQPDTPKLAIIGDIRTAPQVFKGQSFNLLIMTDVIEHLTREHALELLYNMAPLCRSALIFTPTGPWLIGEDFGNPHSHKSAWMPAEFHDDGWLIWEWPQFHHIPDGKVLGAFFAWKQNPASKIRYSIDAISKMAKVNP
jgi:hypothetical protein